MGCATGLSICENGRIVVNDGLGGGGGVMTSFRVRHLKEAKAYRASPRSATI